MRLAALRQQSAKAKAEFRAWLDGVLAACGKEGRALTAEESAKRQEFADKVAQIQGLIEAEELLATLQPDSTRAKPKPAAAPSADELTPALGAGPVGGDGVEVDVPNLAKDPMRGFKHLGEFAQVVKHAQDIGRGKFAGEIDERLLATATPSNFHTSQSEGAEIPPAMRKGIWELVFADPLLSLLDIEPTDSPVVDVISDETTPWGASGITAKWRSEAVVMTADKLVTKTKQVRVHELYSFALVPEELLADAPRLADRLNRKMPAAIAWKLVEAFVTGTGAGQPLGWMSANNDGKIAVTRSGANLIAVADVTGMWKRALVTEGPSKLFWLANRDTISQLMTMSVANQPVWLPPQGLAAAPGGTLLGIPVYFSDHAEALGTAGDLQLVNLAGYYALTRGAAKMDTSIHLFFDYAIQAFRQMVRFGGQPFLNAVVTAAKGPTKSHFVHLTT